VKIEKRMRSVLSGYFEQNKYEINGHNKTLAEIKNRFKISEAVASGILDVMKDKAFIQHITLGEVPSILNRICKNRALNDDDRVKVRALSIMIEDSSRDRNLLAHGEVYDLFDGKDRWLWEQYIKNYVKLYFNLTRGIQSVKRALESVKQTEEKEKRQQDGAGQRR